jgi:hypothetical protein
MTKYTWNGFPTKNVKVKIERRNNWAEVSYSIKNGAYANQTSNRMLLSIKKGIKHIN